MIASVAKPLSAVTSSIAWANSLLSRLPHGLVLLFARIALAHVFWASARTKVEGFTVRDTTFYLFAEEYRLPLISPELAAYVTTVAEHLLPVLLVIGLGSRFAALGLAIMTLVIQLFVYPDAWWPQHSLWLALALVLVAKGPGPLSLDHLIVRAREGRAG